MTAIRSTGNRPVPGRRAAGRHHASHKWTDDLLRQHGSKFASFSLVGGGIFTGGLLLQAALTSGLGVPSFISYMVQAVASVETSFLLNYWITWRNADSSFWPSLARFNVQKVVTISVNMLLYAGLTKLGVNYLLANILLTAVFTVVNYVGADRLVFLGRVRPSRPEHADQVGLERRDSTRWLLVDHSRELSTEPLPHHRYGGPEHKRPDRVVSLAPVATFPSSWAGRTRRLRAMTTGESGTRDSALGCVCRWAMSALIGGWRGVTASEPPGYIIEHSANRLCP